MRTTEVLIVGAGPTGLIMAGLLRRMNVPCLLIESAAEPATTSRALGIQARSLELFKNLGIVQEFLKVGHIARGASLFLNGRQRFTFDFSDIGRDDTPYPFLFLLSQRETEQILTRNLDSWGLSVERSSTLTELEQDAQFVYAQVRNADGEEEEIRASYVVGCDGSHSQVRKSLGLAFGGGAYEHEFVMADADLEWDLPHDKLFAFVDDTGIGVCFPQNKTGLTRVLSIATPEGNEARQTEATTAFPATLDEVEAGLLKASHRQLKLKNPAWVTRFHVHHRAVDKFRVGRVFLCGDAAHIHSPVGAQGMNTGLQDAANLAWKLSRGEKYLSTYHSERHPIALRLLRTTDRLFRVLISRNRFFVAMRNALIPTLAQLIVSRTAGRRFAFQFISQLGIHYPPSEAATEKLSSHADRVFRTTLPTGYRAPNARLSEKKELFDLLIGYRFHALIFTKNPVPSTERSRLAEFPWRNLCEMHWIARSECDTDEAFRRYGVTDQGIFVIRPDGYVGFRSDTI